MSCCFLFSSWRLNGEGELEGELDGGLAVEPASPGVLFRGYLGCWKVGDIWISPFQCLWTLSTTAFLAFNVHFFPFDFLSFLILC